MEATKSIPETIKMPEKNIERMTMFKNQLREIESNKYGYVLAVGDAMGIDPNLYNFDERTLSFVKKQEVVKK